MFRLGIGFIFLLVLSACGGGSDTESSSSPQNTGMTDSYGESQVNANISGTSQGPSNSNTGNSNNPRTSATRQDNTQSALNYISSRHNTVQSSFLSAANSLASKYSALGSLNGGNHIAESIEAYVSEMNNFLNSSIATTKSLNQTLTVDSSRVAAALNTYRKIDIDYAQSYYSAWPYGGLRSTSILDDIKAKINGSYDSAIFSLP